MDGLFIGRVIKVHQHDNSLDVQLVHDGSRLTGVPLMTPMMTTSSGLVDMHHPEGNAWDAAGSTTRDIYVVCALAGENFVALGFISPQVNQMMFNRKNFKVDRHASDVYSTIDDNGNVEIAHPSGSFVRIATDPAHEDLTGQDFDKLWGITRNTAKNVWLSVHVANAGGVKATFRIDPSGNVSLTHTGNLTVNTTGNASLTAASLAITAPTTITGTLAVTGANMTHNGVNVGSTHVHGGVQGGSSNSAVPH
jgi:hypothetical protein